MTRKEANRGAWEEMLETYPPFDADDEAAHWLSACDFPPADVSTVEPGEPSLEDLWFGKTDDLWSFGKPSGWGAVCWSTDVEPNTVSDPFLMTGFDKKTLHLKNESDVKASVEIEVDFLGNGTWSRLKQVDIPANGYVAEVFPDGYSAHWVRTRSLSAFKATAMFIYR